MDARGSALPLLTQVELSWAATEAMGLLRSANGQLYSSSYGPQGRQVGLTTWQKSCGLKGQELIHFSLQRLLMVHCIQISGSASFNDIIRSACGRIT